MMSDQKRALIVDDSKSARLVLRRMLENYDLAVDTVESAPQALDYLTQNRPDAIFMDHMMPGMDGFEAVKAIKSNPDTATIPVMMYTSKGGDLYLGQARALGAVGVLPKSVAPAELFQSLKKVGLVKERRSEERLLSDEDASQRAEDISQRVAKPAPFVEPGMHRPSNAVDMDQLYGHLRSLLEEQSAEIRKDFLLSMETVSRQTGSKINRELDEKLEPLKQEQASTHAPSILPTALLGILLFLSLAWNFSMYNREEVESTGSNGAQADAEQEARQTIAKLEALQSETVNLLNKTWQLAGWVANQELAYPFDEIALDDQRVEIVEQLLDRLNAAGYRGKVIRPRI
jgi:CheY-like chemotaxis protein